MTGRFLVDDGVCRTMRLSTFNLFVVASASAKNENQAEPSLNVPEVYANDENTAESSVSAKKDNEGEPSLNVPETSVKDENTAEPTTETKKENRDEPSSKVPGTTGKPRKKKKRTTTPKKESQGEPSSEVPKKSRKVKKTTTVCWRVMYVKIEAKDLNREAWVLESKVLIRSNHDAAC
ncbi:hypothetical protein NDU88_009426 [Pleurodeles waltl]|uniref:Uncharacterized protein n=1 Tax=Pleurodeles waltl TaxID=8319 RepID=A0AAV7S0Z1_PLEWA|nr:hypothetical protein NDU88_009426 [Pleurodeles waltl]